MNKSLLLAILLLPAGLWADTVPDYSVLGDVQVTGDSACPSCVENMQFSFEWSYTVENTSLGTLYLPYVTGLNSIWSGSFGTTAGAPGYFDPNGHFVSFFDSGGNEIDVGVENTTTVAGDPWAPEVTIQEAFPTAPGGTYASLYACQTATCAVDFLPPPEDNGPADLKSFSATDPPPGVVHTPEPGTLTLLATSMVFMAFLAMKFRRERL